MTIPEDQLKALKREVYSQEFVRYCETDKDLVDCIINHLAGRLLPEWRPIETAPKDGAAILIHTINGVEIARYRKNAWVVFDCADDFYSHEYHTEYPTHWMPLPNPPAAKGE